MKEQFAQNGNRRKNFAIISRLSITLLQLIAFGYVWFSYYNYFAFRTHYYVGGIASALVFYIIYSKLVRLYRADKPGQYSIGETVFSQFLAFGIADLICYVACCLAARNYVSILPGLFTLVIQSLLTCLWAIIAKRYFMNRIPAYDTLVIFSNESVNGFLTKIQEKHKHLFYIHRKISVDEDLGKVLDSIKKSEVVILYQVDYKLREELMHFCINQKKLFYVTPTITDIIARGFENRHFIDSPLIKYNCYKESWSESLAKRLIDIVVSLFGLIITLPITLVTMIAIKIEDGGSIFFKQERYTKDWKKFYILKFRSMIMNAEENGALLCQENDSRITKVGAVIRRFRIDEIPQLINVLKGDMALVGPRPERVENVEKYTEELPQFAYRLQVKSGLTGYAQLYGKYNTSAYDKLRLDLIYIENRSLVLDMKLLMLTLKILFIPESTEGFAEASVVNLMSKSNENLMV